MKPFNKQKINNARSQAAGNFPAAFIIGHYSHNHFLTISLCDEDLELL
jgi:hypothetical protein